jgi:hypothetical protein
VSDLQSALDAIDRALADCDAGLLPPLGHTCLRPGCINGVTTWLNPYYCSERCRAEDNDKPIKQPSATLAAPANVEVFAGPPGAEWIVPSQWTSIGVTSQEDLPEPDSPVTLGWDPAGGAVVAAQRMPEGNIYTRLVPDLTQLREAARRAAEGITLVAEVMRRAGYHLTQWQEQMLLLQQARRDRPAQIQREWLNQPASEPDPMQRALELRRNRNTGPAARQRAPRRIDARRTR